MAKEEIIKSDESKDTSVEKTDAASPAVAVATAPKKKKAKRTVPSGQVHVFATFNLSLIHI